MPTLQRVTPRFVTVCLALILVHISPLSVAAQQTEGSAAAWLAGRAWQQQYKTCFGPDGKPLPDKLLALVASGEERRAYLGSSFTARWEDLALLNVLAGAYCNLHQWKRAEALDRESLAILKKDGARLDAYQTQAPADWYTRKAIIGLAGIFGIQHRWTLAARYYAESVWLEILQDYAPYIGVAYALLALWWLKPPTSPTARASRCAWLGLVLFAASPLLYLLVSLSAGLMFSALLYGNPFASLVLEFCSDHVAPISQTVWVALLLAFSLRFRRNLRQQDLSSDLPTRSTPDTAASAGRVQRGWRRAVIITVVVLLGWMLHCVGYQQFYMQEVLRFPQNLAWWRHSGRVDALWIYNLVMQAGVSSWVQELFFRGVLYEYTRRHFGTGLALAFSSGVFAAWHGPYEQFWYYFWVGIVFAMQYEVSGSLVPSTVTHCLHNFLTLLGMRS